jgi:hypothetical protein
MASSDRRSGAASSGTGTAVERIGQGTGASSLSRGGPIRCPDSADCVVDRGTLVFSGFAQASSVARGHAAARSEGVPYRSKGGSDCLVGRFHGPTRDGLFAQLAAQRLREQDLLCAAGLARAPEHGELQPSSRPTVPKHIPDRERDELVLAQARAEGHGIQPMIAIARPVLAGDLEQESLFPRGQGPWGAG